MAKKDASGHYHDNKGRFTSGESGRESSQNPTNKKLIGKREKAANIYTNGDTSNLEELKRADKQDRIKNMFSRKKCC